jgi:hypothetical protein
MAETLAPGAQASAIIRSLAASDHIRRERAGRASSKYPCGSGRLAEVVTPKIAF